MASLDFWHTLAVWLHVEADFRTKEASNRHRERDVSEPMTAREAMEIGMQIAEKHDIAVREMATHFFADVDLADLAKLLHGNKVWLAAQIMRAMQDAEARAAPPEQC